MQYLPCGFTVVLMLKQKTPTKTKRKTNMNIFKYP